MKKITHLGSAKPDDPIYSGRLEIFSPQEFKPSSTTSEQGTTRATPAESNSGDMETEEDGYRAADLRIAKWLRNDPQKRDELLAKVRATRKPCPT